ncbi:MAG: hypothetical protein ACRD3T_11890 [Terriglobia bacterium]
MKFRLCGADYTLSSETVKEKLEHVAPGSIDKYAVRINNRDYPPKQVISVALGISPDKFISTDATRILRNLGFKIHRQDEPRLAIKNESEELFEAFLKSNGLTDFCFQAAQEGTSTKPDYELHFRGESILFEVKQFEATPEDWRQGTRWLDAYEPIRGKIEAGRKQFKDIQGRCCCLVLYNREKPLVDLSWEYIYAAMLGDLVFHVPLGWGPGTSDADQITRGFGGRGKMHRPDAQGRPLAPQNTTISAVLVLEQFRVGQRRFELEVQRKRKELGRSLLLEESLALLEQSRGTERDLSLVQTRVIVHENRYAQKPLRRDLFYGNYNERYGEKDGRIQRIFAGEQIRALEAQEQGENFSETPNQ